MYQASQEAPLKFMQHVKYLKESQLFSVEVMQPTTPQEGTTASN